MVPSCFQIVQLLLTLALNQHVLSTTPLRHVLLTLAVQCMHVVVRLIVDGIVLGCKAASRSSESETDYRDRRLHSLILRNEWEP